jgi:hypothetical protein
MVNILHLMVVDVPGKRPTTINSRVQFFRRKTPMPTDIQSAFVKQFERLATEDERVESAYRRGFFQAAEAMAEAVGPSLSKGHQARLQTYLTDLWDWRRFPDRAKRIIPPDPPDLSGVPKPPL